MKITKTELMQTIKEELEDMLEYSVEDPHDKLDRMLKDRGVESDQEPGESEEDYWKRKEKKGMSDLFKSGVPQRAAKNLPENKMKITKAKLQQIIKEEYQRTLSEFEHEDPTKAFVEPEGDLAADPEHYEGYLTDEDRTQFLQAYNIISKLTDLSEELRKNPSPAQRQRIEEQMRKMFDFDVLDPVDTAVFNMLGALGIHL